MPILIRANAKINLDFQILGKRPDGYHEIKSVFQSIDLSDFLRFEKSKKNNFTGAIICEDSKNIILKTKLALERETGKKLPCKINLQKSIPIAAGLGGGSADAAATLFTLNALYNLKLPVKKLAEIGEKIGADVPFFLYGGTCKVEGTGERISKIKRSLPDFFVLFRPHKRVETKMMYELHDKTGKSFAELNAEVCPDTAKITKYFGQFKLKEKGLSGSGPTMFCGTDGYSSAKKISAGYPDFNGDIFICRPAAKALEIL